MEGLLKAKEADGGAAEQQSFPYLVVRPPCPASPCQLHAHASVTACKLPHYGSRCTSLLNNSRTATGGFSWCTC